MRKESKVVAVIGGGASGMMAAITAARNGARVLLLEHRDRVGKKILVTGNGRCNFTNAVQQDWCYRGTEKDFPKQALTQFTQKDAISFFKELGMQVKEKNGYYYPYSEQAATVLDVLRKELERMRIKIVYEIQIDCIRKTENNFLILTETGKKIEADRVILATGSMAAPKTGSDGSGYMLAKKLGHSIVEPLPALGPLVARDVYGKSVLKSIHGVRTEANLKLLVQHRIEYEERGELQLTEYGLSGIPVFQLSHQAIRALAQKKKVVVLIDFLPDMKENKVLDLLREQQKRFQKTAEECLNGLFNKKLSPVILRCALVSAEEKKLSMEQEKAILTCVKEFQFEVTGYKGFEQAQVCSGGVNTKEIHEKTMESKLVPALYFAGELLDVDGACGGYNLQWAWSSGYVAGVCAVLHE